MEPFTFDRIELARLLRAAIINYQRARDELIDIGSPNGDDAAREMAILETITDCIERNRSK